MNTVISGRNGQSVRWLSLVLFIILVAPLQVWAGHSGDRDGDRDRDRGGERGRVYDSQRRFPAMPERGERRPDKHYWHDDRFHHNRYYPRTGQVYQHLPERHYRTRYHDRDYFFRGGIWYLPGELGFQVVTPPIGIFTPVLPPYYTTVWVGGMPYYYADNAYYVWRPDHNAYQVTEPPADASEQSVPYAADELFIYPKEGQSEEKLADDRYACYTDSRKQSGYDPASPPEGLSMAQLSDRRETYQRSMHACLESKGYSVR